MHERGADVKELFEKVRRKCVDKERWRKWRWRWGTFTEGMKHQKL